MLSTVENRVIRSCAVSMPGGRRGADSGPTGPNVHCTFCAGARPPIRAPSQGSSISPTGAEATFVLDISEPSPPPPRVADSFRPPHEEKEPFPDSLAQEGLPEAQSGAAAHTQGSAQGGTRKDPLEGLSDLELFLPFCKLPAL